MGIPKIKTTILISLILIVPYLVKLLIAEPYPAIILPSGHAKIKVTTSEYTFESIEIEGVKNDNELFSVIPPDAFLDPAPSRLLGYLAKNEFGLVKKEGMKAATEKNIKLAKIWYADKLIKLGYKPDLFKVVRYSNVIDKNSNTFISKIQASEVVYELH